jgi:rubrerythrin
MEDPQQVQRSSIAPGDEVYDESGRLLGRVSALTDDGFETELVAAGGSHEEEIPGQEFGEGYLMWRCTECGEMGELDNGLPESCPDCGAPREAITQIIED